MVFLFFLNFFVNFLIFVVCFFFYFLLFLPVVVDYRVRLNLNILTNT